jgi:phospholipid/cholesterol/gamma-HCH transport system permease protein
MMKYIEKLGARVLGWLDALGELVMFCGECLYQFRYLPRTKHVFRQMAHLGVDSLPIVSLTILFTGMVITLQTASTFIEYGAQSTVGGVVAIAMGRELAPVLTGVVLAGRVGAAITAEISTMKVTEQIDALKVMAVNPHGYLAVPRLIACMVMLPILVVYSNVIGVIGGYLVAVYYSGINSVTFTQSILQYAVLHDLTGGMIKSVAFGAIIALIGCYQGMNAPNGAVGVGKATTRSVVHSIILIFMFNCILSWLLYR